MLKTISALALVGVLAGCASPAVVSEKSDKDTIMSCGQMVTEQQKIAEFKEKVRGERGVTGTNVAAAVFFWPALIGTAMNTGDAMDAATARSQHLDKMMASKQCSPNTLGEPLPPEIAAKYEKTS